MKNLDIDLVRKQFPALASDWVFFDNAGGSQTLKSVTDRITDYLLSSDVQHGASYAISQIATQRVQQANEAMTTYINAAHSEEVIMLASATLAMRILSISMGKTLQPGDEIIVSNSDHEANVSPWTDLKEQGIIVHIWKVHPDTYQLELEDLERLMNEKTRLVAVTHTSNVLGTLNPVKEIAKIVHDHGALICVDGVAHAPHRLVDVQDLDADFYVFSTYKVYGPHQAVLYGKKEHLLRLPGLNHYFIKEDDLPYKFQPGNVNFELCYGMLGVTDYLQTMYHAHFPHESTDFRTQYQKVFDLFAIHEESLSQRFLDFLHSKSSVKIIGESSADQNKRVPTLSFVVENKRSDEIVEQVDSHQIGIRFGDFYAKKLIQDLGLESHNGVVRVSMAHYNTLEEVDRLVSVLKEII